MYKWLQDYRTAERIGAQTLSHYVFLFPLHSEGLDRYHNSQHTGVLSVAKTPRLVFCEPWNEQFRYLSEAGDWLWWLGTPAQHYCCLRYQTLMALRRK